METWHELFAAASELPPGRDQVALLHQAVDRAEAEPDLDAAFECRVALIEATYHTGQTIEALAAFAWCVARLDEDPERYDEFAHRIAWVNKWMPAKARHHAEVPITRITAMVDDLERRHTADGAGPRTTLAERLDLKLNTGVGADLDDLLAAWRVTDHSDLSDCPACELRLEAEVLLDLDRPADALAVMQPFLAADVAPCADGPTPVCTMAVEPLLDAGRTNDAGEVFRFALRSGRNQVRHGVDVAHLASLLDRTGDAEGARRLVRSQAPVLDGFASAEPLMWAAGYLARALASSPADLPIDVVANALGEVPPAGWSVGSLRERLATIAVEHATAFDTRNGTSTISDRLRSILTAGPLAPAALRGHHARMPVDPDVVLASLPASPAATLPTSIEPAPADRDPAAFHRWAFDRMDQWQASVVQAACDAIWGDPTASSALRLAAAFWLTGASDNPGPNEVLALVDQTAADGEAVPAEIAAGVRTELAAAWLQHGGDPSIAHRLATEAVALLDGEALEDRHVAVALRNAIGVLGAVGDSIGATRALALLDANDPGADSGRPAAVLSALVRLVLAEQAVHGGADPTAEPSAELQRALTGAIDQLAIASSNALAAGGYPVAVHGLAEVAQRRLADGDSAGAVDILRPAAAAVPSGREASSIRLQTHLLLSDATSALAGPVAAMTPQRAAVEAAKESGVEHVEGWARRGLGLQLLNVGRYPEAIVQLTEAADLLSRGGDPVDVLAVQIAQARAELVGGDPVRAGDLAEGVLAAVAAAGITDPNDENIGLVLEGLDIASDAAWADDDPATAERHLAALADLLVAQGQPAALARSNAARGAARAGDAQRALALFERSLDELPTEDGPSRDYARAVVLGRRAEVHWLADDNAEAVADVEEGIELAAEVGDELLVARLTAMGARARHDAYRNLVGADAVLSALRRAGDEAEDALIHGVQQARAIDDDDAAAELEARLTDLRQVRAEVEAPGN